MCDRIWNINQLRSIIIVDGTFNYILVAWILTDVNSWPENQTTGDQIGNTQNAQTHRLIKLGIGVERE